MSIWPTSEGLLVRVPVGSPMFGLYTVVVSKVLKAPSKAKKGISEPSVAAILTPSEVGSKQTQKGKSILELLRILRLV
jgi:hypothetical protein